MTRANPFCDSISLSISSRSAIPSVESGRMPGTSLGYTRSESRKLSRTNSSPSIKRQSIRLRSIRSSNCSSVNSGHLANHRNSSIARHRKMKRRLKHAIPLGTNAGSKRGIGILGSRRSQASIARERYPGVLKRRISGVASQHLENGSHHCKHQQSNQQDPSSITFPSEGSTLITAIPNPSH